MPSAGLALFAIGLLWVCLWQARLRWCGVLVAALGVASLVTVSMPDFLASGSLKQVAFRNDAGYVLARGRVDAMVPEMWGNGLGYAQLPKAETPHWRCDKLGCVAHVNQQKIALPADGAALVEDCMRAQFILADFEPLACANRTPTLNPRLLSGSSVTALWVEGNGAFRIETSADWQGARPWSVRVSEAEED